MTRWNGYATFNNAAGCRGPPELATWSWDLIGRTWVVKVMKNGPYELVVPPYRYPGKRYRGRYAYEHHVVWWETTGQAVGDGFVVHHKNGDRRDNDFGNLEVLPKGEHTGLHNQMARKSDYEVCGTTTGYSRGCRCLECKNAHAVAWKSWVSRKTSVAKLNGQAAPR